LLNGTDNRGNFHVARAFCSAGFWQRGLFVAQASLPAKNIETYSLIVCRQGCLRYMKPDIDSGAKSQY
jgi:hypothetical protein